MKILDGKKTSNKIRLEIKDELSKLISSKNIRPPHLVAILVGDDGASKTYVNAKSKACNNAGFDSTVLNFDKNISQEKLLSEIQKLNDNNDVDGFIVQLPLPSHIDEFEVINHINPSKDIDGFHPENMGRMLLEMDCFVPATPYGIIELLKRYDIKTSGKKVCVIGRSNIVGKPISLLLAQKTTFGNATVTMCHSRTQNIIEITRNSDIIITALGKPHFLKENMIKDGVVIIDVGITRVDDNTKKTGYKLMGDVDFESVKQKVSHITPVPGGVGPMTIAMLLKNTMRAYRNNFLNKK